MNTNEESEISRIAVYYARGVDTLGNEADMDRALSYFRKGFAEDCLFEYYWPDGSCFGNNQGLVNFAEFALGFMQEKNYRNTQHLVSNILIEEREKGAVMMASSVIARHFHQNNSQDLATANYIDEIISEDGAWLCSRRQCIQLSFDNFTPAYTLT